MLIARKMVTLRPLYFTEFEDFGCDVWIGSEIQVLST